MSAARNYLPLPKTAPMSPASPKCRLAGGPATMAAMRDETNAVSRRDIKSIAFIGGSDIQISASLRPAPLNSALYVADGKRLGNFKTILD